MPDDGRELRLSWSRLRSHDECHQKAALIAKGKKSPVADIRMFFQGNVADLAMRRWLDQEHPEPGQMAASIPVLMDEAEQKAMTEGDGALRWRHSNDRAEVQAFVTECVTRLEPLLYQLVIPYDYEPAVRFSAPLMLRHPDGAMQRIFLVGEMDVLCRRLPEYYIHDLKATRDENYWRKTIAQLTFYDLVVCLMFGVYSSAASLMQPMCERRVVPVVISDADRTQMWSRIVRLAEDTWRGEDSPTSDTRFCRDCSVRHACCRFQPDRSGRVPFAL